MLGSTGPRPGCQGLVRRAGWMAALGTILFGVLVSGAAFLHVRRLLRPYLQTTQADWIDDVIGGASGVLGWTLRPVRNFVENVIRPIVSWLLNRIGDVWNGLMDFVWGNIKNLLKVANSLWDAVRDLWNGITNAFNNVVSWAWARIQDIYNFIAGQIDKVFRWAGDRIADVIGFANGILRFVKENVLQPFLNFVAGIYEWIRRNIWDPLWNLIQEAGRFARGIWDWATDQVKRLWGFVDWFMTSVWKVLESAWDWIVFLARFGFDAIREMLSGAWLSPQWWSQQAQRTVMEEGDDIEEWLVRWLD